MCSDEASGMALSEVWTVLDALTAAGCRWWLEGGWGVDALVGRQTRPHRDVDVDVDVGPGGAGEAAALRALHELGYRVETDWRPNRVELAAPGRGWVDLHPIELDGHGNGRQPALGGGFHDFPRAWFVTGSLGGRAVGCYSREAQEHFHRGYALRAVDRLDLARLRDLGPAGG